jgi:hypothetical protein
VSLSTDGGDGGGDGILGSPRYGGDGDGSLLPPPDLDHCWQEMYPHPAASPHQGLSSHRA